MKGEGGWKERVRGRMEGDREDGERGRGRMEWEGNRE